MTTLCSPRIAELALSLLTFAFSHAGRTIAQITHISGRCESLIDKLPIGNVRHIVETGLALSSILNGVRRSLKDPGF